MRPTTRSSSALTRPVVLGPVLLFSLLAEGEADARSKGRTTWYRSLSGRSLRVEDFQGGTLQLRRSLAPGLAFEGTMGRCRNGPPVKVVVPRVGKRSARIDRAPLQMIKVSPGERIAISARGYWSSLYERGATGTPLANRDSTIEHLDRLSYISATPTSGAGLSRLHVLEVPTTTKPGTTIVLSVGDRSQAKKRRLMLTGDGPSVQWRRYLIQVTSPETSAGR